MIEYTTSIEENPISTISDDTFSLQLEFPDNAFFIKTKARLYSVIFHPSVKGAIFAGDLLFADKHMVKAFTGVICSETGTVTIAVVTYFEFIRNKGSTFIKSFKSEFITVMSLLNTMNELENCDGQDKRQMFSLSLLDQMNECIKTLMNDLDNTNLYEIFKTTSDPVNESHSATTKTPKKKRFVSLASNIHFFHLNV